MDITPEQVTVSNKAGAAQPLPVVVCGESCVLAPGESVTAAVGQAVASS